MTGLSQTYKSTYTKSFLQVASTTKGCVETREDLPSRTVSIGDEYFVKMEHYSSYIWDGGNWVLTNS